MKRFCFLFMVCFAVITAGEELNFLAGGLSAGRAALTANEFLVYSSIGGAAFSPELRLPLQLVYRSGSSDEGPFGFGWSVPQVESSAVPRDGGVLWTTPWGEKIQFSPKTKPDKDTLPLYQQEMKGRGFFAPYSDWVADTSASKKKIDETGNWTFTGKRDREGWKFTYRDAKLYLIESPNGDRVTFAYRDGIVSTISGNGKTLIEFTNDGKLITRAEAGGVEYQLRYRTIPTQLLPNTLNDTVRSVPLPRLVAVQRGGLAPEEFAYDALGFLSAVKQGDAVEIFQVEQQSFEERRDQLSNRAQNDPYRGPVAGRLLADRNYRYSYGSVKPGHVTLTDAAGKNAVYDYNGETGVFQITEFSGKRYSIYYFMRYDVAYLGKVRQIVDDRGRVVVSYRYDKLTGNLLRVRDLAENDLNFEYDKAGNLALVTRRAAEQNDPEPVMKYQYNAAGLPEAVTRLDAAGKPVVVTRFAYDGKRRLTAVSDGRGETKIRYNRDGFPETVIDPFGRASSMKYDEFNRLAESTDSFGVTTRYSFNPAGLVGAIARYDGEKLLSGVAVVYDRLGLPISYTDQQKRVKAFERDEFGRVVRELFPDGSNVDYQYDPTGKLQTVVDQNRNPIRFSWDSFGMKSKTTAASQLTDYVHDRYGMLARVDSRDEAGKTDRSIQYEYDKFDRVVKTTYGDGEVETFRYDSRGKLLEAVRGERRATFRYDYFDRLVEKNEGGIVTAYEYNPWGQRVRRVTTDSARNLTIEEKRSYDNFGRLSAIESAEGKLAFVYNDRNQLVMQVANGVPILFEYTPYGQLRKKSMGAAGSVAHR